MFDKVLLALRTASEDMYPGRLAVGSEHVPPRYLCIRRPVNAPRRGAPVLYVALTYACLHTLSLSQMHACIQTTHLAAYTKSDGSQRTKEIHNPCDAT